MGIAACVVGLAACRSPSAPHPTPPGAVSLAGAWANPALSLELAEAAGNVSGMAALQGHRFAVTGSRVADSVSLAFGVDVFWAVFGGSVKEGWLIGAMDGPIWARHQLVNLARVP